MITCTNCNKQLEDGTKFCDNCGTKIVETIFCQNCGKPMSMEFDFCQECGASLAEETVVSNNKKKKKTLKKLIAIGSACIALVLVAAIALSMLFGGKNNNSFALYLKDNEMYYTDTSKIEPWQVTKRFVDDNFTTDDFLEIQYVIGEYTHLSNDGKILFYVDKITEESTGASLFYRYVNKPNQEPVKIDSDIKCYSVSESGKFVTYLKGEEDSLYQHNLTDKEKIASEVDMFFVSNDGKKIVYLNNEDGLYLKYAGKDKEKIDSDVSTISYVNDDLDTVYYKKEDSLYKKSEGEEKEKIASDIYSVIKVFESGEIYYVKNETEEIKLIDYLEDDMKQEDSILTNFGIPEHPFYEDYENYNEYKAAIEQYNLAYNEYKKVLSAKINRNEIRDELSSGKALTISKYTLCYYDGKETNVLTEDLCSLDYTVAKNSPLIIFSTYDKSSVPKVKISEVNNISEIQIKVKAALTSSFKKHIAVEESLSLIEQTKAKNFDISSDGKTVYFLDDISEKTKHGDLYKISISGSKVSKPELYDNDVYTGYFLIDKFIYFKDVKDSKGELYIDKQRIDYDVYIYSLSYFEESDTMVYWVDWDDEKSYGVLKSFKNNKALKIADDVHEYSITPNGEILYLYDYSTKYNKGELFAYKNNKSIKIDDDVAAIAPIYNLKYRGNTYG